MRKVCIAALMCFLIAPSLIQAEHTTITVSGCAMNVNGAFRLLAHDRTYVLKGHHSELFGYNGKLLEITGTVDADVKTTPPNIPIVLHVTKLKKLADSCG